jgi:hypothetical protein
MDGRDRQAIEELFDKLREVERRSPARDREAEALIHQHIARQPGAPYYMGQTIIALEHALAAARERLEEAERRGSGGGFISEIFGGGRGRREDRALSRRRALEDESGRAGAGSPWGYRPSFLGGAMQTAMGVAGGVVLGSFLADLLMPDAAMASEAAATDAGADAGQEASDAGYGPEEDMSGDDGDFGGGDFGGGDFGGGDL